MYQEEDHTPVVAFSQEATCFMYRSVDARYSKSFSRDEQKKFLKEAASQARRVKKLISGFPGSDYDAVICLLEAKILQHEDVMGLERILLRTAEARLLQDWLTRHIGLDA